MIDLNSQINYWITGATDAMETAKVLIDRGRSLHGLFFCHLAIEKAIKAHVVRRTGEVALKSHNLLYLAEKAGLLFESDDELFLGILMRYQLQGRYPDYNPYIPDKEKINDYLLQTELLLKWLQTKLLNY
jgi:HEPN domain-containing protein